MELLKYLDAEADKLHEENFSSSDEFRTVNHSFVEGFNYALAIVQGFKIELNENQQVVLEWLKQVSGTEGSLTRALYSLYHLNLVRKEYFDNLTIDTKEHQLEVRSALRNLSRKQEAQILAAFAEWGMKNEQ